MLAALLGLVTGLILGLTGAGGSVIALPLLMLGLGWTLPQAAPVALLAVCASATLGTLIAWKHRIVRYRAASLMAFTGLLTAPLGLFAAARAPAQVLTLIFAVVLSIVALRLWQQARQRPDETKIVSAHMQGEAVTQRDVPCQVNSDGRLRWDIPCLRAIIASGAGSGFLAGLLGVGGGFVMVPALRAVTTLPMHGAVATSLMTIAITSAYTILMHVASGHTLQWLIALPFALGAIGGMLMGRGIAPHIAGPRLQQGFALLLVGVALWLVWTSRS